MNGNGSQRKFRDDITIRYWWRRYPERGMDNGWMMKVKIIPIHSGDHLQQTMKDGVTPSGRNLQKSGNIMVTEIGKISDRITRSVRFVEMIAIESVLLGRISQYHPGESLEG